MSEGGGGGSTGKSSEIIFAAKSNRKSLGEMGNAELNSKGLCHKHDTGMAGR